MSSHSNALAVGDTHQVVVADNLTRTQIVQYAGASGDYNPLHTDGRFATGAAGYPSVFAHGMLTMGLTGRMLTDWLGHGRLLDFGVRFTRQVWPGDTLTASATVESISAVDAGNVLAVSIRTCNSRGEVVLTGSATALLET